VLAKLGIEARFEAERPHDQTVLNSPECRACLKNRVLHHGTPSVFRENDHLIAALRADPAKFTDKAVKSVRSRVTNIIEHLKEPMDVLRFSN